MPGPENRDFFVSYNRADVEWAEWIASTLEGAGHSVYIQAWDFRPGSNFVLDMQRASAESDRTIAVLSPAYLAAEFTQPEWAAAFARDPMGQERRLIPVRVAECRLPGLLAPIVYIDLVGVADQAKATDALLHGIDPRRPRRAAEYPGHRAAPDQQLVIASSGDLVLVDETVFSTESAACDSGGNWTVVVDEPDAGLQALFGRLRNDSRSVPFAFGNAGGAVQVVAVESLAQGGRHRWTLRLRCAPPIGRQPAEFAYHSSERHFTVDALARLRASRLLLNFPPGRRELLSQPGTPTSRLLFEGVLGNPQEAVLRVLYPILSKDPERFLRAARLTAVFFLTDAGIVEHVLELVLGPITAAGVSVKFSGQRRSTSAREPGTRIELEGTCPLPESA